MYNYHAKVVRIVDGDTLDMEVDLGFNIKITERFRLLGIDTPEIHGVVKDSEEYKAGMKSMARLAELAPVGSLVDVYTSKPAAASKDKYGRYLAEIIDKVSGDFIGEVLLKEGLAKKYP